MTVLSARTGLITIAAVVLAVITGCAHRSQEPLVGDETAAPIASAPEKHVWSGNRSWTTQRLPGKRATHFSQVRMNGRDAMLAVANASASMLRTQTRVPANELDQLRFSWKVPELIAQADLAQREGDDSPVRIVLAFEGDRSKWSAKNAMLSELSRAITGEELPYATLMYEWCNTRAPGTVVHNPRTDRIRKIVVESGSNHLGQWLDYQRDIKADFERAFGEAPGALAGIALLTDSDNTSSQTKAYYGPVSLIDKSPKSVKP